MSCAKTTLPIHPTAARRAFGEDRDHPAIPGGIIGADGDRAAVALVTGTWITVAIDDPWFVVALERKDLSLSRFQGHELVVLVNAAESIRHDHPGTARTGQTHLHYLPTTGAGPRRSARMDHFCSPASARDGGRIA